MMIDADRYESKTPNFKKINKLKITLGITIPILLLR